ncbi:MAG: hypothetical protein S4CHLAM102_11260 [Chlamydiia bacterium]|nr:hypothetical protein [Chlamydiia bacterium]
MSGLSGINSYVRDPLWPEEEGIDYALWDERIENVHPQERRRSLEHLIEALKLDLPAFCKGAPSLLSVKVKLDVITEE